MLFRPRRLGTPVVLGVAIATFVGLAVTSHGFPVQHVSLNDGGIWVTDNAQGTIGRFVKPITQLDGQVTPASASTSVDVWQDGPVVATYDATGGRLYAVNASGPAFYDSGQAISPVPGGIALGDTTLAVLSTDHALRAVTLGAAGGSLSALSAAAKPLAADLPANAAVAVSADDSIWVAGGGELRDFPGGAGPPAVSSLPLSASDPMQVTTVGTTPVVADVTTRMLYLPDSGYIISLPATSSGLELQQPSGASDVVVAATSQALYSVNLSTGQLTTLSTGHSGTASAPVQVAGCVHAAWAAGAVGSYVRSCGTPPPATSVAQTFATNDSAGEPSLVFRINNGSVVLNDTTDGVVFLLGATVTRIEPQWQLASALGRKSRRSQAKHDQQSIPLTANPVTQGVRPGTTTTVHVLDTAKGSPDVTYAVTAVGTPDLAGVTVAIAPDAQTVLATVTALSTDAHFQYTISDGHGHSASNEVTLVPRGPGQNAAPALRVNYQQPALKVAAGGNLVVPVIGDWRDYDGDPLYVEAGSVTASAGSAGVTSSGALSYTAPATSANKTVTLRYGVSDGRVAKPTMASLKISVLGSSSTQFIAPAAEPDAATAVVGAPVTLQPLANDLPGVDPTNRGARLALAAPVPAVPGATVATDLASGAVTFTAQHPGDFFLNYTDAYGAAPTANGSIRVHVLPATGTPMPPVTTPAVAVLHGQQPAMVDVLANDYDPQGWILGVTGATTTDPGVHVAVVGQQWLRVSADNPVPGMVATVRYTVSDGRKSATGTVAVSAAPADQNADQITTTQAQVTVRAGDSAAVSALAGDSSSAGLPLAIDGVPLTANPPVAGLLLGVQGRDVRIGAPAGVSAEEETTVSYVATDANGTTATGSIDVTIMPPPSKARPDQAPEPQEVDARETAGDVVVIPVPVNGVDPDGDSVTVTGVTAAPALGRIIAVSPDSITYQSYPGSYGTDTLGYQVTDRYGLTGTAQIRIAVLPPGLPQPPTAVDDVINAPPGAALHWNVLSNDFIAPGDKVSIEPLAKTNTTPPAGVRLAGSYVYLKAPASPSDPPVEFSYGLTDGSATSLARVVVHAVAGAELPPIANDVVATPPAANAAAVTVNVLKNDDDPVGPPGDLKITSVPAGVTVHGADLTIRLAAQPREVPYQVTAPDGLTATAVVYVPGTAKPPIRLKPGALITLGQGGSKTVPLSSVLTDAPGRQLKITTLSQLTAAPAGNLTASADQATSVQVHALGDYAGPGAVTVQVYDGATLQAPGGNTATVTIPVQVGSGAPVLRCTAAPVPVPEGGAPLNWDIGQLCQAWTTDATAPVSYTAGWAKPATGVSAAVTGGTSLQLTAASGAVPGGTGTLEVTPVGASTGAPLHVTVTSAPLPSSSPVNVTVRAGQSRTVDLSQYVTSPLAQPDIQVLAVSSPPGLTVTRNGSLVTISAARTHAAGQVSVVAMVTDVAGRTGRAVSVPIAVNVATASGVPGAPGQPTATASNRTIVVSFGSAAANGSPVEYYTVYANGTPHQCAASPCTVTGLANGTRYTIYVTATNSAGQGARSGTTTATPTGVPGQVTGLATVAGNGTVTLTWQPVTGARVTGYRVEISPPPAGQQQIRQVGLAASATFTGLVNGTAYTFTVMAANAAGNGPWSLGVSATPFGRPAAPGAPTAVASAAGTVTVSWVPPQANGTQITGYTVREYQAASSAGPWQTLAASQAVSGTVTSTSFTVTNGDWYEYTVTATSQTGTTAPSPLSTPAVQAATPPGPPTGLTATGQNNAIAVHFTAAANSQAAAIEYGINAPAESGTITGPFTAGTAYTETLTNAMNAAIVNGTPVTVYLAECDSAGQCSTWAGPTAQVTPRGPAPGPSPTPTPSHTTPAPGPGPVTSSPAPGPGPVTSSPAPAPAQAPAAPSGLTATPVDANDIALSWQVNSTDQTGFAINNGVTTTDVGANATSYTWGGLSPGTYMCFRILAYNGAGNSPWDPSTSPYYVCTTTPSPSQSPSPPPPPPAACTPSVSISPGSGPVGTQFTVTGAGWLPGTISRSDSGSGITWADPTADANGNWQTTMTADAAVAEGSHSLTFLESGCSNVTETLTVTAPACTSSASISPSSGPAGSSFTLSGSGWPAGDVLQFVQISKMGNTSNLGLPVTVTVGGSGSWQAAGAIPANAVVSDVYQIAIDDTGGCTQAASPTVNFTVTS